MGSSEKVETIGAGKSVVIDCPDGCGVTGPWGFSWMASGNDVIASDGTDLFKSTLSNNPIWTQLPFVKAGNVAKLPDAVWAYGGPASAEQFVGALVDRMTGA